MNTISGVDWTKEETKANYVLEDGTQWKDYDARLPIRCAYIFKFPGNRWKDQASLPGKVCVQ